jgi:tRNA pseudouridine38-40 synthase
MPHVALRIAYDGQRFAGSQRQPDQRTVEGEVLRGLAKVGALESAEAGGFQCSSRTDRGVSAAANVVAFDTAFRTDVLLPALGASVEDVWPHALALVPAGWDARHARSRTYAYFLPDAALDAAKVHDALQVFVGQHDFRAFARVEEGVNPVRRVLRCEARREGGFVVLTVQGESFLWNQVRRMVAAARQVARGEATLEDLHAGLRGERVDLGTAPAEGLVLMDVDHGLDWTSHPASTEAARRELGQRLAGLERAARVAAALRDALPP